MVEHSPQQRHSLLLFEQTLQKATVTGCFRKSFSLLKEMKLFFRDLFLKMWLGGTERMLETVERGNNKLLVFGLFMVFV